MGLILEARSPNFFFAGSVCALSVLDVHILPLSGT